MEPSKTPQALLMRHTFVVLSLVLPGCFFVVAWPVPTLDLHSKIHYLAAIWSQVTRMKESSDRIKFIYIG